MVTDACADWKEWGGGGFRETCHFKSYIIYAYEILLNAYHT